MTKIKLFYQVCIWTVVILFGACASKNSTDLKSEYYALDQKLKLLLIYTPETDNGLLASELYLKGKPYKILNHPGESLFAVNGLDTFKVMLSAIPILQIEIKSTMKKDKKQSARIQLTGHNDSLKFAGIRLRGGNALNYPKKSFRLELWKDSAGLENQKHSLLGMRTDDDWNLNALFNEPLRIRSSINNELWISQQSSDKRRTQTSGVATQYVDVVLNGNYQGIYLLSELIDAKQLGIKKKKGAMLFKGNQLGVPSFDSDPPPINGQDTWAGFEQKFPKKEVKWEELHALLNWVRTTSDKQFYIEVEQQVAINNCHDYFLFFNLIRAEDNRGKNIFFAKEATDKPFCFIPWDLDGTLGNLWDGNRYGEVNDFLSNGFFNRLYRYSKNVDYSDSLISRWFHLRKGVFQEDSMLQKITTKINFLSSNKVYERETMAWPSYTFNSNESIYVKDWLHKRIHFLDSAFRQPVLIYKNRYPK